MQNHSVLIVVHVNIRTDGQTQTCKRIKIFTRSPMQAKQFLRRIWQGGKATRCVTLFSQECIPVGCVPSAAVTVSRGGGVSDPGGGLLMGGCLFRGVSVLGGCLLLGVSSSGGRCLLPGGCLLCGGCGIPACTEADTPIPHPLWTDRCL